MNDESNFTFLPYSESLRSETCLADDARLCSSSRVSPFLIFSSLAAISFGSLGKRAAFLTFPSSHRNEPNHLVTRIIALCILNPDKKATGTPCVLSHTLRKQCAVGVGRLE